MSSLDVPAQPVRHFADGASLPDLVRYLREGVYIMDADGALLDANPVAQDLFGLAITDETPRPVVHDRSRPPSTWRAELEALAVDGTVREFTREFVHPDGTRHTVLDTCYARNDHGTVTYHGVLADITAGPPRPHPMRDETTARDPGTGAYTAEFLYSLESEYASHPDAHLGCCVVQVDPPEGSHDVATALDERLERMTRFLLRHIRATESIVRSAPHELLLVLPRADDTTTETIARRLQLAALRSAPAPFRLGWAARGPRETIVHVADRARHGLIPVRVVERAFEQVRQE